MNIFLQVGDLTGFSFFKTIVHGIARSHRIFPKLERGSVNRKWNIKTIATLNEVLQRCITII